MGATILWQPIGGKSLNVGARSAFVHALGIDNGSREFDAGQTDFLRGMAAANEGFRAACDELLDAIAEHGRVRVWAEY